MERVEVSRGKALLIGAGAIGALFVVFFLIQVVFRPFGPHADSAGAIKACQDIVFSKLRPGFTHWSAQSAVVVSGDDWQSRGYVEVDGIEAGIYACSLHWTGSVFTGDGDVIR